MFRRLPILPLLCIPYVIGWRFDGTFRIFHSRFVAATIIIIIGMIYVIYFKNILVNKSFLKAFTLLFIAFIFVILFNVLITKLDDLTFFARSFKAFLFILVSGVLAVMLHNRGYGLTIILKLIMTFMIINSTIILISVFEPSLQIYIDNLNAFEGNITDFESELRFRGLMQSEGDNLSVFKSAYLLFFIYLYRGFNSREKFFFLLGCIVVLSSILFIGRTGIITLSIIIVIAMFHHQSQRINVIMLILLLSPIFILLVGYHFRTLPNNLIKVIEWAFFDFTDAIKILFERHIFLPDSTTTLIFGGDPYFGPYGDGTISRSDSGFVNLIFATGIIGTGIIWSSFLYISIWFQTHQRYLYLSYLAIYAVANLKVAVLFSQWMLSLFALLLFMALLENRDKTINYHN